MVVNSDKEKKIERYRTYVEAARFLINFYQAEKKGTLEVDKVSRKMADNLKTAVLNELQCKELITEMAADDSVFARGGCKWLALLKVRGHSYLQVDKQARLNDLTALCDTAITSLH